MSTAEVPWSKRKHESAASYALFLRYRDAGWRRSLEMIATGADLPTADASASKSSPDVVQNPALPKISNLKALCRRNRWIERVEAWDAHLQAIRDQVRERNARKREERALSRDDELWEAYQKMRAKGLLALEMPLVERQRKTVVDAYEDGRAKTINVEVFKPIRCSLKDAALVLKIAHELRDEATGHQPANQMPESQEAPDSPRPPMFIEVDEVTRDPGPLPARPPEPVADPPVPIEPIPEPSPPIPTPTAAKPGPQARPPGLARPSLDPMLDELAKRKL